MTTQKNEPIIAPMLGDASGGASSAGYHQIESFLKCPKRFQFDKVRGITTPRSGTPMHFAVGTLFHAGRARWFTSGFQAWDDCQEHINAAMKKALEEYKLPVPPATLGIVSEYMRQYVNHYVGQPHPKTVAAEYPVGPSEICGVTRTARLDDVSYYHEGGGRLWIGESKTTSDMNGTLTQYRMHGQPMLQVLLWRAAHNGAPILGDVAGVMLDITEKGYGGKPCRFHREPIEVTQHSLDWYAENLAKAVRDSQTIEWDSEVERRIASCTEMVGTKRVECPYHGLCRYGRDAGLSYVLADGTRLTDFVATEHQTKMPWE